MEANAIHNNKSSCDTPRKAFPIQTGPFENLGIPREGVRVALLQRSQRKHRQFSSD